MSAVARWLRGHRLPRIATVVFTFLLPLTNVVSAAIVVMTATVRPFMHPGFRELHNPGFDKLLPLVRELAAEGTRPVLTILPSMMRPGVFITPLAAMSA